MAWLGSEAEFRSESLPHERELFAVSPTTRVDAEEAQRWTEYMPGGLLRGNTVMRRPVLQPAICVESVSNSGISFLENGQKTEESKGKRKEKKKEHNCPCRVSWTA